MLEQYYTQAREQGVLFTRYDPESKPEVSEENGALVVTAVDPAIQRKVRLKPDLLVLSAAIIPRDNDSVANLFKVSRTLDKFYLEAHMKLRPVDFAADGIFMAGMGHGPKPIHESISQAAAAVSRVCTVISKDRMQVAAWWPRWTRRNAPSVSSVCVPARTMCPISMRTGIPRSIRPSARAVGTACPSARRRQSSSSTTRTTRSWRRAGRCYSKKRSHPQAKSPKIPEEQERRNMAESFEPEILAYCCNY